VLWSYVADEGVMSDIAEIPVAKLPPSSSANVIKMPLGRNVSDKTGG
jgi:hypothetical protein